jgi:hypothetical protein
MVSTFDIEPLKRNRRAADPGVGLAGIAPIPATLPVS